MRALLLLMLAAAPALAAPGEREVDGEVEWKTFEEAREASRTSRKPILALFWAEW